MLASRIHIVTLRETPADAEVVSQKLMSRAGMIYKSSSGLYVYTYLLYRTLQKIKDIVSEEMAGIGALEMTFPILQDRGLWEESGRWEVYLRSRTMFTTTDRRDTTYGLAPTAEEVVTDYVRSTARSYRQLPVTVFQQNTKFRDEIRPRFGLLRVKEFLMKDAYSFDVDTAGLDKSYQDMRQAYHRIFQRMGLEAFAVDADPGAIGGSGSHEFMVAADAGEDTILFEPGCGYAANVEKATSRLAPPQGADEDTRPIRVVETPATRTCDELHRLFPDVPVARMVKTLIVMAAYSDREEAWAVLMRGDQEVNEVKLQNRLGALSVRMASDREVTAATGADVGYAGPVGLPKHVKVVADESVRGMRNILCGVNRSEYHALDANIGVDFAEPTYADLRAAREGEPCVVNGAPLQKRRGIEVGHIFKLGTKYSAAMKANFVDSDGTERPYVMGCYGIGVSRVAAAAVEQSNDADGIVWPVSIAPFEVVVLPILPTAGTQLEAAKRLYEGLRAAGVDVLLDERDAKAGVRLKDADLIGFPYKVVVGKEFDASGRVEITRRTSRTDVTRLSIEEAIPFLADEIRQRKGAR